MKLRINSILIIFLFGFFSSLGFCKNSLGAPPIVNQLEKTPLPRIHMPAIQKETLDNGLRLLLLPDDETPVVEGTFYIRTGAIYEPADRLGLAMITGELLRIGGTKQLPPDAFDEALANLGAEVNSSIDREYGVVTFKCLAEDLPQVLSLVFQMLREPAFDSQRLALAKLQAVEKLRRENDQPDDIAQREFPKLIYGRDNPWARAPTTQTISAISREEVEAFYRRFYHPDRMILAMAGDFSKKQLTDEIQKATQDWSKASEPLPTVPEMQRNWGEGTYLIQKNFDQATLILGHYGERRFNPDKYALILLNDILGGDVLGSRLGKQIRSSLGLAYGVYSNFGLQTDYGIFYIFAQTKAVSTQQVLKEIHSILTEVAGAKTLTEDELEEHKQSVVNSLYSQYEPRSRFVMEEARFEYLGYPPNYLSIFRDKIQQVSLKDLQRVAQKYLHPGSLKVLVVGAAKKTGEIPGAQILPLEIF
jgi:zinc protease